MEVMEKNVPVSQTTFGVRKLNRAQNSVFQTPRLMPVCLKGKSEQRTLKNSAGATKRSWICSMCDAIWVFPPQVGTLNRKKGNNDTTLRDK
jgi:hypothetical protein